MNLDFNNMGWSNEFKAILKKEVDEQASSTRKIRQPHILQIFGDYDPNTDSVVSHTIEPGRTDRIGKAFSIPPGPPLIPVKIECNFMLYPEQVNDEGRIKALARMTARQIALAEDAVILYGKDAFKKLNNYGVVATNLADQKHSLIKKSQSPVQLDILKSILKGISDLQTKGHYGDYCAIVSTDLYQEAYTPIQTTFDAPIHQILPRLREGGFLYSQALDEKTGVLLSLGGGTIDIAVPLDAVPAFTKEDNEFYLRVVERFVLRVNDTDAVVPLT